MKIKLVIITFLLLNSIFPNVREEKITNPIIAMGLSAVIPGSGQIYNGDWKRGLIYLGLEVFSMTQMNKYNKNAKSYIEEYETYADEHWKIDKWMQDFYLFKNHEEFYESFVDYGEDETFHTPDDEYLGPWGYSHGPDFRYNNAVYSNLNIQSLYEGVCGENSEGNVIENGGKCDLYEIPDNNAFVVDNDQYSPCSPSNTENCFPYYVMPWGILEFDADNGYSETPDYSSIYLVRDHHLYEGIGKYNEFFAGWDDATLEEARQIFKNNSYVVTSDRKDHYQNIRNKSNREFDKDEIFLSLIFINHAVSMFDAFLTSINRTRQVSIDSKMNYGYNNGIEISLKW